MKEKALQRSEEDEIRELKSMIITKLCEAGVKGFETRQQLLDNLLKEKRQNQQEKTENFNPGTQMQDQAAMALENPNLFDLDERTFLAYKKNQFDLLERLLTSSYFLQNQNQSRKEEIEEEKAATFLAEVYNKSGGAHFMRREKKAQSIKLSRYLRDDLSKMPEEHIDVNKYLSGMKEKDYHRIGVNELEKFIRTRSDKSYYNPKVIEENYDTVKEFMVDLKNKGKIKASDLSNEEVDELINACSFSLNGVHYLQKFKKSKNMIHPTDLLFMLSKIK